LTNRYIDAQEPMTGPPLIFDEKIKLFAVQMMESGKKS
jgi:hypothetical protein